MVCFKTFVVSRDISRVRRLKNCGVINMKDLEGICLGSIRIIIFFIKLRYTTMWCNVFIMQLSTERHVSTLQCHHQAI